MEKLQIKEAIVVEGRYDKNALSQVVDTLILETRGFGIFKDKEQMVLLRQVAKTRGLLVMTDSDGAGFVIRNRLITAIDQKYLKHIYIPDCYGKEKRKKQGSKEGKLGVEGMTAEVLRDLILAVGQRKNRSEGEISNSDFMAWGLTGGEDSKERRLKLQKSLSLPENMSKKALLQLLNSCYTKEELENILKG